ncbi:MAG TPA: LysM domain-containing protein [Polyangiaceae bacterium]|nr:LysM domain-containing protein [Polyangiaceae bacterium]
MLRRLSLGPAILLILGLSSRAFAQAGPSASPAGNPGEGASSGPLAPGTTTVVVQPSPTGGTAYGPSFGPSMSDLNKGLPSSSQSRTGNETDHFDLDSGKTGAAVVYGNKGAGGIVGPQKPLEVPAIHVVKKGDTLWDLCGSYYQNPWGWPKVWSYNPQIVNPHWIYPGDQVRLRDPNELPGMAQSGLGSAGPGGNPKAKSGRTAPTTVFLRDHGFLGDAQRDVWGELVGAVEDQMLLSDGNHVYMMMRPGVELSPGQKLTIFTPLRKPDEVPGSRKPPGEIVSVKGTIKIDQFNPQTRVARGEVVESLDVIERGFKVGPVGRQFDVVPPKAATKTVQARVLSSLYPHTIMGQNQVAFLDRGSEDGLEPGTRLFVLRQGDAWRNSLNVGNTMLKYRIKIESSKPSDTERTPLEGEDKQFPSEVVAELRVLRTEKYSSLAMVMETRRELEPGDVAISIEGK